MRQRLVTGLALTLSGAAAAAMLVSAPSAFADTNSADSQLVSSASGAQVAQAAAYDDDDSYQDGYQNGYRQGYNDGLGDAKDNCEEDNDLRKQSQAQNDYERGYGDGFDKGYRAGYQFGFDNFCDR